MSSYLLHLEFEEEQKPLLLDITSLLYDLELTHDLGVLLTHDNYSDHQFSRYFWYREGRPVVKRHRVRVARIVKQSPLMLEIVIPCLGAIWVLLQIIEKVENWPLSRKKLELEVEKLQRESDQHRDTVRQQHIDQLGALLQERDAAQIAKSLAKRLSESPMKLARLEVKKLDASNDHEY